MIQLATGALRLRLSRGLRTGLAQLKAESYNSIVWRKFAMIAVPEKWRKIGKLSHVFAWLSSSFIAAPVQPLVSLLALSTLHDSRSP